MRPSAIVPVLLCVAALILSFLCLFAGHKKNFMEDYHLLTLNTSRLGYEFLNTTNGDSSNPITDLFNQFTNDVQEDINDVLGDTAEALGLDDFYSVHMMDYCFGDYTPTPLPNDTVSSSDIHKNVTGCSNQTAMYKFDPTAIIEEKLNESGISVTLDDLNWPDDIQKGIDALHILQVTVFVLYCIAIALIALSLVAAVFSVFASGRLSACLNFLLCGCAFLAIGLASAIITAVIVKGSEIINKYGNDIGIEAHRGDKFLAITWAATAAMFVVIVWWLGDFCVGRRKKTATYAKHG